jgi:flagellar biosynthesis/type III secretory pathway M-ring protein FliF/YscJ
MEISLNPSTMIQSSLALVGAISIADALREIAAAVKQPDKKTNALIRIGMAVAVVVIIILIVYIAFMFNCVSTKNKTDESDDIDETVDEGGLIEELKDNVPKEAFKQLPSDPTKQTSTEPSKNPQQTQHQYEHMENLWGLSSGMSTDVPFGM